MSVNAGYFTPARPQSAGSSPPGQSSGRWISLRSMLLALFILGAADAAGTATIRVSARSRTTWYSRRPSGTTVGPRQLTCSEPPRQPFYVYDFEITRLCNPPDILQRLQERAAGPNGITQWAQHVGAEVFLHQQLMYHPQQSPLPLPSRAQHDHLPAVQAHRAPFCLGPCPPAWGDLQQGSSLLGAGNCQSHNGTIPISCSPQDVQVQQPGHRQARHLQGQGDRGGHVRRLPQVPQPDAILRGKCSQGGRNGARMAKASSDGDR
eukprot:scaffold177289_cov41-Prasinocladus_malaysianus.AAC.1